MDIKNDIYRETETCKIHNIQIKYRQKNVRRDRQRDTFTHTFAHTFVQT